MTGYLRLGRLPLRRSRRRHRERDPRITVRGEGVAIQEMKGEAPCPLDRRVAAFAAPRDDDCVHRRLAPAALLLTALALAVVEPAFAQTRLEAPGGVAAQTITNSPINIYNRDPEEIRRLAQQLDRSEGDRRAAEQKAADLARQLDQTNITAQTVVGFLRVLARQSDLQVDQVPAKMAEITAKYVQMQERLANLALQDPAAADLAR